MCVFVHMCSCIRGSESLHSYRFFFFVVGCVCLCLCVLRMSKNLMLSAPLLPNQLSCMVNKSVLIGSALQHRRYQNLIKSLFQPCLVARNKLCSVAMDTRQVTNYQTWKHSTGLSFSGDYMCTPRNALIRFPNI